MTLELLRRRQPAAVVARSRSLWRDRKGAVAMLFGLAAIPLLLLVGLAVDFGFIAQTRAQLDLAADTAALTAAQSAGAAFVANNPNVATPSVQGIAAGTAWFTAQVGTIPDVVKSSSNPSVTVNVVPSGNSFTSTVTYTANVTTIFHQFFGITSVPISNTAEATIVANAYVDVTFLLDNSSSMLIAATTGGVTQLQTATAQSSTWQLTGNPGCTGSSLVTQGPYKVTVSTPASATGASGSAAYPGNNDWNINGLQGCQCAFACHWQPLTGSKFTTGTTTFTGKGVDTLSGAVNSSNATQTYTLDYYGIARFNGVQLRFDVVQSAVETAIGYMQSSEEIPSQFGASVFEFGNALTQDWPPTSDSATQATTDMACLQTTAAGCNGNALAAAQAISSPVTTDSANTDFPAAMSALVTQAQASLSAAGLTSAGNGSTPAKAKRSLIIITDGIQDWGGRQMVAGYSLLPGNSSNPNGAEGPISLEDCAAIKSLGYTVYVLYTTYITTPVTVVLSNTQLVNYVNGTTGTAYDLPTNLAGCASEPADYTEASNPTDIQTALQAMVKAALNSGARLSL